MMVRLFYLVWRRISAIARSRADKWRTSLLFLGNGVRHGAFRTSGVPFVMVARGGRMTIGNNFAMNNGAKGNPIGCFQPCTLWVDCGAEIVIGDNVGISQAALVSHCRIEVQRNVKIGGGSSIYTTDFHSLDPAIRASADDMKLRKCSPVVICEGAFIGAHCIILKGVTIGRNSIVGAGSVVAKSIPDGEVWAGNPAKFIRKL